MAPQNNGQPRDLKTSIIDLFGKVADTIGKAVSTPSGDANLGQVMMQRLLTRDELMNQYLYKLIFGEAPARHVTVERKI